MRHVTAIRRSLALVVPILLLPCSGAMAQGYGWSLSFSNMDPDVAEGAAFPGVGTVYLWFNCNWSDGAAAYGANVTATGGALIADFTPEAGVLNAGTPTALLLAIAGCPDGPHLVGSFTVVGTTTDLCMDTAITVDCDQITPTEYPSNAQGASAGGGVVCGHLCESLATAESSWGSIKGLYR